MDREKEGQGKAKRTDGAQGKSRGENEATGKAKGKKAAKGNDSKNSKNSKNSINQTTRLGDPEGVIVSGLAPKDSKAFPPFAQGPFARAILAAVAACPLEGADMEFFFMHGYLSSNSMIALDYCLRAKPWAWMPYIKRMVGDMNPLPETEVQALKALEQVSSAEGKSRALHLPDPGLVPFHLAPNQDVDQHVDHQVDHPRCNWYSLSERLILGQSLDLLRRSQARALELSGIESHHGVRTYRDQINLEPWRLPGPSDIRIFAGDEAALKKFREHRFELIGFEKVRARDPILETATIDNDNSNNNNGHIEVIENIIPVRGVLKGETNRKVWEEGTPLQNKWSGSLVVPEWPVKEYRELYKGMTVAVFYSSPGASAGASHELSAPSAPSTARMSQRIAFSNGNRVNPKAPQPQKKATKKSRAAALTNHHHVRVTRECEGGI
jgi:hypothetical protein